MKILIIKLGALGDVIRTFPLLSAIKEKYPNSEISWITKKNALDLLNSNPFIDNLYDLKQFSGGFFDILYNFDIDGEAIKLALKIKANKKYGFYSNQGFPAAFNFGAEYYLNTLFDDELKKTNKKTYQEMMFKVAELPYIKKHTPLFLTKKDRSYAKKFVLENKIDIKNLIGIHMGASKRWPSKKWPFSKLKEFIFKLKKIGYNVLIFGGPNERESISKLVSDLNFQGIEVYQNNPDNNLKEFISLVDICDHIVCSDSLAMHVGISLKKPTTALFFCTTPHEVEGYGYLRKIISPLFEKYFPEKQDQYIEELVNSISPDQVLNEINKEIPIKCVNAVIFNKTKDKFLIIKRKAGIHAGKWAFPGGIVEIGESLENALKREIKEEVGLEIEKITNQISEYIYLRENNQKTFGTCYVVKTKSKEVFPNNEILDFKWVDLEEFQNLGFIDGLDEEAKIAFMYKNK